jgi:DNA-3-methyladenine glycosylase
MSTFYPRHGRGTPRPEGRPVPLPRGFFDRNAALVAPELVGCLLLRRARGGLRAVRITETEAYVGAHDLACHSRMGRTARNAVMFGPAGRAYVYLIYGLHQCLNVVCGPGGDPNAVLLRAAEPVDLQGLRLLPPLHSTVGPGNLCRALQIGQQHNRVDLCRDRSPLWICGRVGPEPQLWTGPRVGIDYAGDWADAPLRFCDRKSRHLSRPLPPR